MKFSGILIGIFAIILFLACGTASGDSQEAPDGQKLYKTYCVTCHGVNGGMQLNGARDLRASELGLEERVSVISNGRNLMAAYKGIMTADEIKVVATYTMGLGEGERKGE
jgi:cytochrome c6